VTFRSNTSKVGNGARSREPAHHAPGTAWSYFREDRSRYGRSAWLTERALWAIATYRLGQATLERDDWVSWVLLVPYAALSQLVRLLTNIEIPRTAQIGPGLRIAHGGPVIINAETTIGANCSLNVGVVLGTDGPDSSAAPTIGNDVRFGAHSIVIGTVTVGDGATIGALTLVRTDVPDRSRAVGVPARILPPKQYPVDDRRTS
jgi:serine O-acetyltransferase